MGDGNSNCVNLKVTAGEELFYFVERDGEDDQKVLRRGVKKGHGMYFRIPVDSTYEKMFKCYCERSKLAPKSIVFKLGSGPEEGKWSHRLDTSSSLGMEDGDCLIAYHRDNFVAEEATSADSMGADFGKLLWNEHLSDVVLEVGAERERIFAHRSVLASRSPKFEGLFSGRFAESSAPEIKLPAQELRLFKLLLCYLYTNKVELPRTTAAVLELLVMADEYLCGGLKKLCEEELLERLSVENACDIFSAATLHGLQESVDISKRVIINNFHDLPDEALGPLKRKPDLLLEVARAGIRPRKRARTNN